MRYWVWLTQLPYIGSVSANRLLDKFGIPEAIYNADREDLVKITGINNRQIKSILTNRKLDQADSILDNCEKCGIFILTKQDKLYPDRVKKYRDAPSILYYKGKIREVKHTVGIVGARRCTQDTKQFVAELTEKFVSDNHTIVSGMAKGVDSYAHTVCVNAGGYTIAILGNGLDLCYPSEHVKLMQAIEEKGLLLSEYPPGTRPTRYSFPMRNRLISAWSDELVVVQAGKGSGALITADYTRKYNKSVCFY